MSWSGQNSEKPPIPQGEQQLYPPPPTDPNHYQQQQQQQQQPQSGFSEKPTSELPGQQPGGQYFPPPPSGPPPAGQPQFTHAPQPQYGASQQQQQQHQPYGQPPQGQFPPGQQPGENPALYGAGHHYTATGATHADPAAAPAAAAFASTETTQPQKQHRGWGERLSQMGMKAAVPINALANKMGSQSFLPTTMDKECEKAGKILRSFCKEGIASDVPPQPVSDHLEPGKHAEGHGSRPVTPNKDKEKVRKEQKAIVKIPSKVINKAVGLAIFTTARAGFQFSGATGSGILIARLPDGSWGPPSGIQVHSVGAGFMIGVDIFDGVLVINNKEALSAFMGTRVSLGPDVAVVAGPYGAGGNLDVGASFGGKKSDDKQAAEQAASAADATPTDGKLRPDDKQNKRRSSSTSLKPVFSYVKSRGFYAGIQVDGTVVTERKDANAAFYGQKVSVEQIVRGQVPPQGPNGMWPAGAQPLYEALRIAEAQQSLPEVNLPQATPAAPPGTGAVPGQAPGYGVPPHQAQYGGVPQQPQYGGKPEGTALPAYGQPQYPHHEGGPLGSHPPDYSNPTASGALGGGEQLPGYVDDGAHRPGVGDHKGPATYQ